MFGEKRIGKIGIKKEIDSEKPFQVTGSWFGVILLLAAVCTADAFGYICLADFLTSGSVTCTYKDEYIYDRAQEKDSLKELAQWYCADRG